MTSFSYNDYSYNLNNKKNRIFCNNCGNYGHLFHNCKKPITSIGIICFRINKIKNNQLEYLMVQRKDSMGYVDILRGKYNIHNNFHIKNILNEITHNEKQNIIKFNYKQLWIKLWDITDSDEISKINSNKNNNETKFEHLKKNPIFINHNTKYSEPEWGFPKGRRNNGETDIECAIREFEEETGFSHDIIKIFENIYTLEENFTGSNLKSYKHKYFIAFIDFKDSHNIHNFQKSEIGNMKWMSYNETISSIRDYNYEKIDLVKRVYYILNTYKFVC